LEVREIAGADKAAEIWRILADWRQDRLLRQPLKVVETDNGGAFQPT